MFTFVGTLFHSISVVLGAGLIAFGAFISGGTAATSTIQASSTTTTDITSPSSSQTVARENSSASVEHKAVSSASSSPVKAGALSTTLQIEDINTSVSGDSATISWKTTLPAESRLIFDNGKGRVFESEDGIATTHHVHISELQTSAEYDYEITATTADKGQNDDFYSTLYSQKEYEAQFGEEKDGCQAIIISDTAGHPTPNMEIKVFPSMKIAGSVSYIKGSVSYTTDSKGQFEYCGHENTFKLLSDNLEVTISK